MKTNITVAIVAVVLVAYLAYLTDRIATQEAYWKVVIKSYPEDVQERFYREVTAEK